MVFLNQQARLAADILELAVEYIAEHYAPDEVFSEEDLTDWAMKNGFKPED